MKRVALLLAFWAMTPEAAFAHADGLPIPPSDLWHHWNFDPLIWGALIVGHWLYGRGALRARVNPGYARVLPNWRIGCFAAGEIAVFIALLSPLDALGETLLSAHMAQHILLTAVAPLLLVLGRPMTAFFWAAPRTWRPAARWRPVQNLSSFLNKLADPMIATPLHAIAIWAWHAPAAFEAALQQPALHFLEHMSFFVSGFLFWTAATRKQTRPAVGAGIVLITFMHSGVLGAVLTLAPAQTYPIYSNWAVLWGMSALTDQQLAGLMMWAPAGAPYLAAFVMLASRALGRAPAMVSSGPLPYRDQQTGA